MREHTELQSTALARRSAKSPAACSGPTVDNPSAMAYVDAAFSAAGHAVNAIVRGKAVPMVVCAMPFVPNRYYRG